jgi:serine/threonine protein kinase/WD40 repeat protein
MPENGQQIGHYKILSAIGAGGMGEVFLAEDTKLGRKVAIKFLKDAFSGDAAKLSRFVREAKAVSALNHPNILTVYEIGEIDNQNYLVTEFIEGATLRRFLSTQKIPPLPKILKIGVQVAEALAAAHRAGIVHRDIKPENIMIREDGYAKVLDFGLAKLAENKIPASEDDKTFVPTTPGLILGTAWYMSPEQTRGLETDSRTDIWSLGVVLYEMLAGKPPFAGETFNHTAVAILEKEPPRLENAPEELQRIIRKALTKDKERRYQTVRDLLIDLENLKRTLDVQDELDRSYGGTSSESQRALAFSFRESETQTFLESRSEKTNAVAPAQQTAQAGGGKRLSFYTKAALLLLVLGAIIAPLAWWYYGGREKVETTEGAGLLKSIGITSWSSGSNELIVEAAFSPDAKMIAYSSGRSGAMEIWIKPTVGGDSIQVTKTGFYNQHPVWSPSGQEIAFYSSRGDKGGIWRTSFTGGEQSIITGDISGISKLRGWTAGGKIYFQNDADLFSVDEKSGEIKRVTDFAARQMQPRVIEISPDESKIAFVVKENDLYKIKFKQLDSEQIIEIASFKDQIDNLTWHPNGKDLIFSAAADGTFQIFKGSIDAGASPVQLSTGDADSFVQDVSSDGSRILFWSQNETSDLWAAGVQDGRETLLAGGMASEYWAAVSPDGKAVVYQSVAKAGRPFSGSIEVKSLAEKEAPLTISPNGFSPVWSKNNSWIAFYKRTGKDIEIWGVEATGADARRLAAGTIQPPGYISMPYLKIGVNHLTFTPDGDAVVYTAQRDGISNIYLVKPDGKREQQLTGNEDAAERLCCPAWTHDGKYFVAVSNYISPDRAARPNFNRLWLYAADGSEKKMLYETRERFRFLGIAGDGKSAVIAISPDSKVSTPTPDAIYINLVSLETGADSRIHTLTNAYSYNIHLSPDGKAIAFVTRRENVSEIWIIPVAGGTPRKLIAENDPKIFISSLSWSPDGKLIVFGRQSQNSLLSMLIK